MGTSSIYLLPQLPKKGTENINHSKNARDSPLFQGSSDMRFLLPFKQTFQDDKSTTQRGQQSILLSLNSLHWKELALRKFLGVPWTFWSMATLLSLTRDFRFFWAAELDQIRRKEEPAGYSKHFFLPCFLQEYLLQSLQIFRNWKLLNWESIFRERKGWSERPLKMLKIEIEAPWRLCSASIHNVFKKRRFEAPASDKRCKITLQNWNSAWYSCIMNTLQCGDAFVCSLQILP